MTTLTPPELPRRLMGVISLGPAVASSAMHAASRWVGIDVGGRRRGFHLAFVDERAHVTLARARTVDECQELLRSATDLVAIDAPASWAPAGMRSRPCERAFQRLQYCNIRFSPDLAGAAGRTDGYYEWIEHGLELWDACRDAKVKAIECFPTASWTAWFGKRQQASRAEWTQRALAVFAAAGLAGTTAICNQDDRDALAAALTARQWDLLPATMQRLDDLIVPQRDSWPLAVHPPHPPSARGRLDNSRTAPEIGEVTTILVEQAGLVVEQIVSGRLDAPAQYCEEHDEWALVVEGAATLEIDGELHELGPGDWIWLPAATPHRLLSTAPGTRWIAVHHRR